MRGVTERMKIIWVNKTVFKNNKRLKVVAEFVWPKRFELCAPKQSGGRYELAKLVLGKHTWLAYKKILLKSAAL